MAVHSINLARVEPRWNVHHVGVAIQAVDQSAVAALYERRASLRIQDRRSWTVATRIKLIHDLPAGRVALE
jgi:hypothetical protein